ncbi:MAG: DNA-directed DNA polymerase, partial [Thiomicrorhabdus sp.]|nr:DNA-directed DNA polymerase [Thiomicrorhabdus sp.]
SEFSEKLVQSLLCHQPVDNEPCEQCNGCKTYLAGSNPDFMDIQVAEDKKQISVDQIRALSKFITLSRSFSAYRVILLHPVEAMNMNAANSLLKSLEEPADNTVIILLATHLNQILPTIKSRCQQLNFSPPLLKEAVNWLQQAMPHVDLPLIKRALRVNWGAPLDAKAWLEAEKFNEDSQWKEGLKQLQSGQKTVSQVTALWLKWPTPTSVFDYFYLWSVSAVRSVTYAEGFQASTQTAAQQIQLQNWLAFQQAVLQAKQYWLQNANKELVFETLCLEWLEVQQSPAIFQSTFASNLQKGTLS